MFRDDSGVYLITNLINGKKYVGQSLGIRQRWLAHLRRKSCLALYSALEKYGKDNFKFEVVYCTNDKEEMNRVETLLIKEHNSMYPNGYNLLGGGGSPNEMADFVKEKIREAQLNGANYMKGKKHSPETIAKMKAARKAQGNFRLGVKTSEETKLKQSKAHTGKIRSDETKALLRIVRLGNKNALGHKLSDEAKKMISLANKGRISPRAGCKLTDETKALISKNRKGKLASEDTKEKMRVARLGVPSGRKGIPWTEAQRNSRKNKVKEIENS